jgi:hypothetical protein
MRAGGRGSVLAVTAAALFMFGLPARAAPADTPHLPDVRTLKPSDLNIQHDGAVKELRLTNKIWNGGNGPLELRPVNSGNTTVAYQRIYTHDAAGNWSLAQETQIGTFTFHPDHFHWHFEGFALYELRDVAPGGGVGPNVIATSEKISFCILDTFTFNPNLEHSGEGGTYGCGASNLQGLKVGNGDEYHSGLAGQEIDITGVPDGIYWLLSTADFENRIKETRETNNTGRVKIQIIGDTVKTLR